MNEFSLENKVEKWQQALVNVTLQFDDDKREYNVEDIVN
jgi:hypothetical protein